MASVLQLPPAALLLAAEIKIAALIAAMFLPLSYHARRRLRGRDHRRDHHCRRHALADLERERAIHRQRGRALPCP